MPVVYSEIASNEATATLAFAQGSLNVEYYPLRITDEMLVQLQSFSSQSTDEGSALLNMRHLNEMLIGIIKSWDLLEDDRETVIPLTVERLARLSPVIKSLVVQAIMGDIRPETMAPVMK